MCTVSADASIPFEESASLLTVPVVPKKAICTSFNDIHAYVVDTSINLLFHKVWRCVVNACDACSILCSQRRRGGHGVASMSRNHFLICFETAMYCVSRSGRSQLEEVLLTLRLNNLNQLSRGSFVVSLLAHRCEITGTGSFEVKMSLRQKEGRWDGGTCH